MIYILGDLHGNWSALKRAAALVESDDVIIQVGDFGIYPSCLDDLKESFPAGFPCRVLVVDGNHEDFNIINQWSKDTPTEFHTNFFYMPRGYVTEINGEVFGFLGGAESVDRAWRTLGVDLFAEERVQMEDIDTLISNLNGRPLDVLITHSPPEFVNRTYFPKFKEEEWNLPLGWIDESAVRINKAHWAVRPKKHYCGHMHSVITHDGIRIVDINEFVEHK